MCAAKDEVSELGNLYLSSPMDFYYTSQGKYLFGRKLYIKIFLSRRYPKVRRLILSTFYLSIFLQTFWEYLKVTLSFSEENIHTNIFLKVVVILKFGDLYFLFFPIIFSFKINLLCISKKYVKLHNSAVMLFLSQQK